MGPLTAASRRIPALTPMQRDIVRLLQAGQSDQEIGVRLRCARTRVQKRIGDIYRRLDVTGCANPRTVAAVALWLADERERAG
ncbi:MAG TPA: LuxR C-terminal-related transcriptional regulator [Thermomicrobiales bacterium]|jgi:DNA-binding CsgD family transcriptional regulator